MYVVKEMIVKNINNPLRKLEKVYGLAVHWTANTGKGANAIANAKYFDRPYVKKIKGYFEANGTTEFRYASANYIMDKDMLVIAIKPGYVSYNVGASKYTALKTKLFGLKNPNNFLEGLEMCVNVDGDWAKTYENSVLFCAKWLVDNGFKDDVDGHLFRHYDITGKNCPAMMTNEAKWTAFKTAVKAKIKELLTKK